MLSMKEYMEKVGVTKEEYVINWINQDLIPGVRKSTEGSYLFPESARRPYRARCKERTNAKTIRASIVNACLKQQYISPSTFHLSKSEFESYIADLAKRGLIVQREDDGIVYYGSTAESEKLKGIGVKELAKKVHKCIVVVEPILSVAASTLAIADTLL